MRSLVNLSISVIPWIASGLSRWMYRNNRVPWAPGDIGLIAFGSGAAVFKLGWKGGAKVLRICRKSLGKSSAGLLAMKVAQIERATHE